MKERIIIELARNPDIQEDVEALVCKLCGISKRNPMFDRTLKARNAENRVLDFISDYDGIKKIMGLEEVKEGGNTRYCTEGIHPEEYIKAFKEFERRLAYQQGLGSPEENWSAMQSELVGIIKKRG